MQRHHASTALSADRECGIEVLQSRNQAGSGERGIGVSGFGDRNCPQNTRWAKEEMPTAGDSRDKRSTGAGGSGIPTVPVLWSHSRSTSPKKGTNMYIGLN